jgi:hypothetical protein
MKVMETVTLLEIAEFLTAMDSLAVPTLNLLITEDMINYDYAN